MFDFRTAFIYHIRDRDVHELNIRNVTCYIKHWLYYSIRKKSCFVWIHPGKFLSQNEILPSRMEDVCIDFKRENQEKKIMNSKKIKRNETWYRSSALFFQWLCSFQSNPLDIIENPYQLLHSLFCPCGSRWIAALTSRSP